LESLNLLLSGYTPYIPTTDQPLALEVSQKKLYGCWEWGVRAVIPKLCVATHFLVAKILGKY
jgi:hypothetical protein